MVLFRRIERIQARVDYLKDSSPAILNFAYDVYMPIDVVLSALKQFRAEFPHVDVHMHLLPNESVNVKMKAGQIDVAVGALFDSFQYDGIDGRQIGIADVVLVAAPAHPLSKKADFTQADLDDHQQLSLINEAPKPGTETYLINPTEYWTTDNIYMFAELIMTGKFWGWAHRPQIQRWLDKGQIKVLTTSSVNQVTRRFGAAWPVSKTGGHVVQRLIDLMSEHFD